MTTHSSSCSSIEPSQPSHYAKKRQSIVLNSEAIKSRHSDWLLVSHSVTIVIKHQDSIRYTEPPLHPNGKLPNVMWMRDEEWNGQHSVEEVEDLPDTVFLNCDEYASCCSCSTLVNVTVTQPPWWWSLQTADRGRATSPSLRVWQSAKSLNIV